MSRRIRWYRLEAEPSVSLHRLADMMNARKYSATTGSGFKLDTIQSGRVEGRFIERIETKERLEDPFGDTTEFERVSFRIVEFRLGRNSPELEIIDPMKGTSSFVNRLSEMLNFSVVIEPLRADLKRLLTGFEQHVEAVSVVAIETSSMSLTNTIEARVVLRGTEDVRPSINRLVGDRAYEIDRMTLSWHGTSSTRLTCSVSRFGAKFDKSDEPFVYPVLRRVVNGYAGSTKNKH